MKSVEAWMPLYVADYLKGTRHLSTEEHGAYLLLLMTAWTSDGALPADDDRLRRLTGMDPKSWKASRGVLLEFFTRDGDTWRHKRVDAEMDRARDISAERSAAGKRGAAARWGSHDGNCHSPANSKRMAKPLTNGKQTDAPSPSHTPIEEPDGSSLSPKPPLPDQFDAFWKAYPRRVGKEAARKAWAACIKRGVQPWHMIEGAQWLSDHPPDDPQFIPHPSTWLNQGRYDDERTLNGNRPMARNGSPTDRQYRRSIGMEFLRDAASDAGFDWGRTAEADGGA